MNEPNMLPPSLTELSMGFLSRPVEEVDLTLDSEVIPHEVSVGYRIEPRLAWSETKSLTSDLSVEAKATDVSMPNEWATMCARQGASASLPMAMGAYPQQVRELTQLLAESDFTKLQPKGEATKSREASTSMKAWANQKAEGDIRSACHAVGVLRAAGDFQAAQELLNRIKAKAGSLDKDLIANEQAALLWSQGQAEEATKIWESLDAEKAAVLFNLGMAYLFMNRYAAARDRLRKSIDRMPEASSWLHLAGLYLALAELRN